MIGLPLRKINNKGFTLLEVILVLSILTILTGSIFSLLFFGKNAYDKGSNQINLQSDVFLASNYLTEETRVGTEVTLLQQVPEDFDIQYQYFFLDDNGKLIHWQVDQGQIQKRQVTDNLKSLAFTKSTDTNNLLQVSITGEYRGKNFDVITEILILNERDIEGENGVALRFKSEKDNN